MSDTPDAAQPTPAPVADPVKKGARWVAILIALSLLWYFLADRFTPYTQRALFVQQDSYLLSRSSKSP